MSNVLPSPKWDQLKPVERIIIRYLVNKATTSDQEIIKSEIISQDLNLYGSNLSRDLHSLSLQKIVILSKQGRHRVVKLDIDAVKKFLDVSLTHIPNKDLDKYQQQITNLKAQEKRLMDENTELKKQNQELMQKVARGSQNQPKSQKQLEIPKADLQQVKILEARLEASKRKLENLEKEHEKTLLENAKYRKNHLDVAETVDAVYKAPIDAYDAKDEKKFIALQDLVERIENGDVSIENGEIILPEDWKYDH